MWSLLFRSKIRLERELAVERCRRELLERENTGLRERLAKTETQFERLRDAALVRVGAIHEPLREVPAPPASPLLGALSAMGMNSYTPKNIPSLSDAAMPDE